MWASGMFVRNWMDRTSACLAKNDASDNKKAFDNGSKPVLMIKFSVPAEQRTALNMLTRSQKSN
jgi:hypothetical protein